MPSGMQQLVLDKPLHCNARDVSVCVLSSARVRCQYGLVPDAFILDFEPVTVDFTPNRDTNCGRLSLTFSTISLNESLVSHRNPYAFWHWSFFSVIHDYESRTHGHTCMTHIVTRT